MDNIFDEKKTNASSDAVMVTDVWAESVAEAWGFTAKKENTTVPTVKMVLKNISNYLKED